MAEPNELPTPAPRSVGRLIGDGVAWLGSFATHVAALGFLALVSTITPIEKAAVLFAPPAPEEEPLPIEEAFRVSEDLSVEVGALSDGGAGDAAAAAPLEAEVSVASLDLQALAELGDIPTLEASTPLVTAPDPNDQLVVRGVGAVGTTGSSGAIDRLTGEILLSLEQRPTLVVWLFDRSESLTDQREEVVRRFDRVYEELGVAADRGAAGLQDAPDAPADDEDPDDAPLLTTVAGFASGVEYFTRRPTADVAAIKAAVRAIGPDETGEENVFGAVLDALERHKRYRLRAPKRNVMIVLLTDEAGDDVARLDQAVRACRTLQTPVYAVGAPAPFGRVDAYVRYVDPDPAYDQTPQWLPVRQGPETLFPERLRLGFFGAGDFDGPTLDSGFGPFGLTRLTAETGGFFISVHPFRVDSGRANYRGDRMASAIDHFFDERLMRRYRPDYVPDAEYRRRVNENAAKRALVEAAQMSWTAPLENVRREFPKLDEAQFAQDLSVAQRAAAVLEPRLAQLVATLRRGEEGRPEIGAARWAAGFDLAMGHALASKVRAEGYNAKLAEAKQGMPFTTERKDTWVIDPADEIGTGSRAEAEATQARDYLSRVVSEHEGTPWALLAQRELERPLGWRWRDEFRNLAERRERERENENRPPREEPKPKPRRPPPKL